jgi:hypothetical protein
LRGSVRSLREFTEGRFIPGIALPFVMLAMTGISFYTLAWSSFAWGISMSRRSSPTGGLSWFLAALSAFMGSSPGGVVCLAVACLLELVLRDSMAERTAPLTSLLLASADGSVSGLTLPLLGCAVALALDNRTARGLLCAAGMASGLLLSGPPSSPASDRLTEFRLPVRCPIYDWHDTLIVTRSMPLLRVDFTSHVGSLYPMRITSSAGPGDRCAGWIRQGDDFHFVADGSDTLLMRGYEPFSVTLTGNWRPFSPGWIELRMLGGT